MNRSLHFQKGLIIFGTPLCIIGLMVFLAQSSAFILHPDSMAIGITLDLVLTAPLVYFLLIRKTTIPKTTIVPFFIFGIIVCSLILPLENQYYLGLVKTWALPVVEILVLFYIGYHIRNAIQQFKLDRKESFDFFTTLKSTCQKILPKMVVMPVVMEMAVFYYGFVYWRKRALKKNEFSHYKESGSIALFIAIICIVSIETVVLHMLLAKWNTIAAYTVTFLSIYSGIQIFGFLKSMLKRPSSIEGNRLFLRYGIMAETVIDLEDIDAIEITSKDIVLDKETRKLSVLGELESHNLIIRLKKENELIGLYGQKKKYRNLALSVDNTAEFKKQVQLIPQ
ncbi:MAG: hypothetical protein NXH86_16645 [Flavobacteriaceae bacterium]|uniref:hypothetical protein n=1 Tax=Flagellimonas TaxID=444459 RepID=UPI003BACEBAD|nr:hypothetical protein [Flavobacteriaceae bacterium]